MVVLHIIDPETSDDALETLALLLTQSRIPQQVLALGHQSVLRRAQRAGVPTAALSSGRSAGWGDPAGWRALHQAVKIHQPDALHAWGPRGVAAAGAQLRFKGERLATIAAPPSENLLTLLKLANRRGRWHLIAASESIAQQLEDAGAGRQARLGRALVIHPGINLDAATGESKQALRQTIGISAAETPAILLAGGPEPDSGHDVGLWATGIFHQIYPHARVMVRATESEQRALDTAARIFTRGLPVPEIATFVSPEIPWSRLVQAADLLVVSPAQACAMGSVLWAMAARVPVIGTTRPCVTEVIANGRTGVLAAMPREGGVAKVLCGQIEAFMSNPEMRGPITEAAYALVATHYRPEQTLLGYEATWAHAAADAQALPPPTRTESAAELHGIVS